jgi:hypothetical protein
MRNIISLCEYILAKIESALSSFAAFLNTANNVSLSFKNINVYFLFVLLFTITQSASAQDVSNEAIMASFYLDNDILTGNQNDRDYTGGLAFTFSGADAAKHPFSLDSSLDWANKISSVDSVLSSSFKFNAQTLHSCELGLVTFTPKLLTAEEPIFDDRPYASLLYLSNTQIHFNNDKSKTMITSLSFGFLGLSLAGDIQNGIHRAVGSEVANGWHNQISNGGEPTFKYSVALQTHYDTDNDFLQLTTLSGLSIGYITEATFGVSLRTGIIKTPPWTFNVYNGNYGEKAMVTTPTTNGLNEFFLVAGANVKARAYNSLLQGQFRESSVSYSDNEIEHLIYESWLGLGCEFQSGVRISYLLRHQSSELKVGLGNRSFTYGELIVSYKF